MPPCISANSFCPSSLEMHFNLTPLSLLLYSSLSTNWYILDCLVIFSISSGSSSSSSSSRPRGGRSPCRCLVLPRRPPRPMGGRFLLGSPPPPWAFSLSRLSYSAFCCTTRYSTLLQLERSWPLVRWILQYCLSEPSCLSAAATGAGSLPEPPACVCLAGASLPDSSTASTSFLLFLRL